MPATPCSAPSGALGATRPDPPPHPHNPPSGLIRAVTPSVATPLPLSHRPRLSTRAGDRSGLAQVLRALQHPPSIHSLPNSAYDSFQLSPFRLIFVLEKTEHCKSSVTCHEEGINQTTSILVDQARSRSVESRDGIGNTFQRCDGARRAYPAPRCRPDPNSSFGIQNDGKSLHHLYHSNSSRMVNTSNWRLRAKKTFTLSSNAVMRVSAQHPKVSPSSSSVSEIIARNRCHRRPAKLNAFNRSCIPASSIKSYRRRLFVLRWQGGTHAAPV